MNSFLHYRLCSSKPGLSHFQSFTVTNPRFQRCYFIYIKCEHGRTHSIRKRDKKKKKKENDDLKLLFHQFNIIEFFTTKKKMGKKRLPQLQLHKKKLILNINFVIIILVHQRTISKDTRTLRFM